MPCNVIAEEILTDHPAALPRDARSRARTRRTRSPTPSASASALEALELVVVIDVAMTETARHADYVLPAASQFEKWEATFFNLEFPRNTFHLRAPLLEPLPGTLPEPEIYARLMRALGVVPEAAARAAARRGAMRAGLRSRRRSCRRRWATGAVAALRAVRALRDARPDAAGRRGRGRRAVGPRASLRDEVPRRRPPGRARRRRGAVRGDPRGPLRDHVHARRVRGRVGYVSASGQRIALEIPELLDEFATLATAPPRLHDGRAAARPVRRRAPREHRQHDHPRPGLAQARRRRRAADQPRRRDRGSGWRRRSARGSRPRAGRPRRSSR